MKVAIGSLFRDSTGYFPRYLSQVHALRDALVARGDEIRCIWVEGDSIDATWGMLTSTLNEQLLGRVVHRPHGGPRWGSVVHPDRMRALGYVGNGVMENIHEGTDVLFFVESDLIWDVDTALALIDSAYKNRTVTVPMVMYQPGWFYDVWAFRKNGQPFGPNAPYHAGIAGKDTVALDSAGSCLAIPSEGFEARYGDEAIVDLCRDLWSRGVSIILDQRLQIWHP